ncbi:accessory factor UbiK family protein [Litoribacillus peritrichatus]|uniref:Ubiquinone biosynthesis accessory factor UbiK n=1 Tax=Litoribacillus peritrichatus TaxID=718191 RepID=A0ABP7MMR2_9GAMM
MLPNELFNTLAAQLTQAIPGASGAAKMAQEEIHNNIKVILSSALNKLELVTREEFDAQTEVLHRSREMIEALEKRVSDLEQKDA